MDNDHLRAVEEALRAKGGGNAELLATETRLPIGLVQQALDRLVRNRLARVVGPGAEMGFERYEPLPAGRRF